MVGKKKKKDEGINPKTQTGHVIVCEYSALPLTYPIRVLVFGFVPELLNVICIKKKDKIFQFKPLCICRVCIKVTLLYA